MFICPRCGTNNLDLAARIELPPDSRSDEIALQLLRCRHCGLPAVGVYEESRRGPLDSEHWSHSGWVVTTAVWEALAAQMAACPRPDDARCGCAVHRELGARNPHGRWNGLDSHPLGAFFPIRRASGAS